MKDYLLMQIVMLNLDMSFFVQNNTEFTEGSAQESQRLAQEVARINFHWLMNCKVEITIP